MIGDSHYNRIQRLFKRIAKSDIAYKNVKDLTEEDYPYKNASLLQMYMGLRIGEANALSLEDIDLDKKQIYIHKTVILDRNEQPIINENTKTEAGTRILPIPDNILPYLKEQMEIAKTHKNHLLFVNSKK